MTHRRDFLSAMAMSVGAVSGRAGWAAASERVRVAVIGVRGRGTDFVGVFAANSGSKVVAVCDIDDASFARPLEAMKSHEQKAPRIEKDFRRLLDDKSIDAVTIAAPDHWHALMTVTACQAGKDVYVEKPVSRDVVEGRRMVQAARKYERVVQAGTQRRSTAHVTSDRTSARWSYWQSRHGSSLDSSETEAYWPRLTGTGSHRCRLRHVARART